MYSYTEKKAYKFVFMLKTIDTKLILGYAANRSSNGRHHKKLRGGSGVYVITVSYGL